MNSNLRVKAIVAMSKNNGIGIKNKLPWHFKSDMRHFSSLTTGEGNNCVIMGKNTYLSIGKCLPNRKNIVLSSTLDSTMHDNVQICSTLDEAFCLAADCDELWVIGGSKLYTDLIHRNLIDDVYVTYIDKEYECDVFFPDILHKFEMDNTFTKEVYDEDILLCFTRYMYARNLVEHDKSGI